MTHVTVGTLLALAVLAQASPSKDVPRDGASIMPPLHGEAMTFDPVRGRIVAFGGVADQTWLEGTWEWNDPAWHRVDAGAPAPALRSGHAMLYHPDDGAVYVFGGMHAPPVEQRCDAWRYADRIWERIFDGPCMTERTVNASLVFDTRTHAMLLLEGPAVATQEAQPLRMWRWTGNDWSLVDASGPKRTGFSAAVYDERRQVLVVPVLFGGSDAGVWEWNGSTWRHNAAPGGPATRQTYSLVYDTARGRIVLAGGQGSSRGPYFDDVWSWDGKTWAPIETSPSRHPAGRAGAWLLNDPDHRRLLYLGGYNDAVLQDLWSLDASGWRVLREP